MTRGRRHRPRVRHQNSNHTLTADATAIYVCVNNGGGNPSAQNKTAVAGPVSADRTNNITVSLGTID